VFCPNCKKLIIIFKHYNIGKVKRNLPEINVICPKCHKLFINNSKEELITCPDSKCNENFNPKVGNYSKGQIVCLNCQDKFKLQQLVEKFKHSFQLKLNALEIYCTKCKTRSYKIPDVFDYKLFQKAKNEYNQKKKDLLIPNDEIPNNSSTEGLLRMKFRYWIDLFNERQLLLLSELLDKIVCLQKDYSYSLQESFLLAFSSSLEYQSMFTENHWTMKQIGNTFAKHAYGMMWHSVENNIWGTKKGNGTFRNYCDTIRTAIKYASKPFEKNLSNNIFFPPEKIHANIVGSFDLLENTERASILKCQSSNDLSFIPNEKIDAVITDPPYFDNIMYADLSDFFYVWLRKILKDRYTHFIPNETPKLDELVKNKKKMKDNLFFESELTKIFKECNRVLKKNGKLIFSYHHKKQEAYEVILNSLIKSNFAIIAVFPVPSEPKYSFHIRNRNSIEYDAIIICQKGLKRNESIYWEKFKEKLSLEIQMLIKTINGSLGKLNVRDKSVIMFGKFLQLYSVYHPIKYDKDKFLELNECLIKFQNEFFDQKPE
jgi:adenine-specific DNA methylase